MELRYVERIVSTPIDENNARLELKLILQYKTPIFGFDPALAKWIDVPIVKYSIRSQNET